MLKFEVGSPFPMPLDAKEGAVFSVEPYTMLLIYQFRNPTAEEIQEFKTGSYQLAVTELQSVLFILSKFGRLGWADAAYSTQLSHSSKELPELQEGNRGYSIDAFLVDCDTNIIKAHRLIRMTPEFSRKFRLLLLDDLQKEFNADQYWQAVSRVFASYATKDLVRLSLLQMKGNEPQPTE